MADTTKKATESKRIQVRLPRIPGQTGDQFEYYSVNFKGYLIERGKYVDVPEELAEVIRNGENAEEAAFQYAKEKALREPKA